MCDACTADTKYAETGRAWVGGLGVALVIPFLAKRFKSGVIRDLCPKHRESLCNCLAQLGETLGVAFRIIARGDGFYITCDDDEICDLGSR
jgi:hypothetical protein